MHEKSLGQVAYEAYRKDAGFRSLIDNKPLPTWEQLAPAIQHSWEAAAERVAHEAVATKERMRVYVDLLRQELEKL